MENELRFLKIKSAFFSTGIHQNEGKGVRFMNNLEDSSHEEIKDLKSSILPVISTIFFIYRRGIFTSLVDE